MQKFQQYLSTIDADNPKKTPIHVINDIAAGLDKSFVKQVTSFFYFDSWHWSDKTHFFLSPYLVVFAPVTLV
jgi:hypothetical protein